MKNKMRNVQFLLKKAFVEKNSVSYLLKNYGSLKPLMIWEIKVFFP